jgi:hypothetical protein
MKGLKTSPTVPQANNLGFADSGETRGNASAGSQ